MMYKSQFKKNWPLWLVLWSRVTYCFILKQTQYLNELSCVGYGVFGVFSRVSGFACVVFSRDIDAWACDQGKCWSSSHRKQRPPAASSRRSDSHKPLRDDRPKHTHTHTLTESLTTEDVANSHTSPCFCVGHLSFLLMRLVCEQKLQKCVERRRHILLYICCDDQRPTHTVLL